MCKTAGEQLEIDDDFAGFESLEDWDAYDRFIDDDIPVGDPRPLDPEMEEIISRLEDEWCSTR
jgi:hypothetical protein